MPLYDVTHKDSLVKPKNSESYEILQVASKSAGIVRFNKDCDIIDTSLRDLIDRATPENKLVFTKAGFLVGHKSVLKHVDVGHIWKTAEMAYPTNLSQGRALDLANEMQLKFVGGLVRWRISLQPAIWLTFRRDSGTFNKYTGKEIKISEYWIKKDYVFPEQKKKEAEWEYERNQKRSFSNNPLQI
jgi:hypothetical protein